MGRLKDLTATPTSTEWTLPETKLAQWLRNGTLSLRLSYKPKPLMDIFLECSALLSPRRHINKSRQPATPRLPTRSLLEQNSWSCTRISQKLRRLLQSLLPKINFHRTEYSKSDLNYSKIEFLFETQNHSLYLDFMKFDIRNDRKIIRHLSILSIY